MKKKITFGLIGLTAATALTAGIAAAVPFDDKGHGFMQQNSDVQDAIENNNYDAFINALQSIDSDAAERITEEMFENIVLKHETREKLDAAIKEGNYDSYIEALSEIKPHAADNFTEDDFNRKVERYLNHLALEEAIENNDYDAWLEAVSNMPHGTDMAEIITEDDFTAYVQIHLAREEGDFETAKELAEELGITPRPMKAEMSEKFEANGIKNRVKGFFKGRS